MENVRVSVIIPYFRSENTIDRAIKSIINQSQKVGEILIVDDCSNRQIDKKKLIDLENSIKILKVIFLNENRGPGNARNIGMDCAKYEYIAFLDSDDIWTENKIQKQYQVMIETNAFISGHKSAIYNHEVDESLKIKRIKPLDQLIKNRFPTRSVMLKNSNKYRFVSNKRYAEDFLLWTQIILNKEKAILIDEVLANSFKEDFGESGLTSNLTEMYKGVIDSYKVLLSEKKINKISFLILTIYQTFKHIFRITRVKVRNK